MRNHFGMLNIFLIALLWFGIALFVLAVSLPFYFMAFMWFLGGGWVFLIVVLVVDGLFLWLTTRAGVWVVFIDVFSKRTKLEGRVSRKWIKETYTPPSGDRPGGTTRDYHIVVEGEQFTVSRRIYRWLSQGDEAVVHYWPHSKNVSRVDKRSRDSSTQEHC